MKEVMFPPAFLDQLRRRIRLADLVRSRVRLLRTAHGCVGLCPFHVEKKPSFYVIDEENIFHCFGCGAHGDAICFLMRTENLDFIEAVHRLAHIAALPTPEIRRKFNH